MNNFIQQFRDSICHAGLTPPDIVIPGKMHFFPGKGESKGNTDGWCKLFEDEFGGCFGEFSTGLSETWQAKNDRPISLHERSAFKRQAEEAHERAKIELQKQYDDASLEANSTWNSSAPANNDQPFLVRQEINANGARLHNNGLVLSISSNKKLDSLQFISDDGKKSFLPGGKLNGGFYNFGTTRGANVLCIAKDFVTGASIHQATGYPVAIAFSSSNLEPVAISMRAKLPNLLIIICADDDTHIEGNPGITKAARAALAIEGKVAVPEFGDQRPYEANNFNDMAKLSGIGSVAKVINATKTFNPNIEPSQREWDTPLPLTSSVEPEPYPLDGLPNMLREAVEEVQAFTQAPMPLVVSSALAALSLATQAHADVKRAEKLSGPIGLFLLTIAESGERKSTCDGFFMKAIRDYETNQAELAKPMIKEHTVAMEAWEAKRGGIKAKINQLAKAGKTSHDQVDALHELEHEKPEPPRVPRLIYGDATPEALKWNLAKGWPSAGVVSSEAGLVFGAHGMGKESAMRNLATLNQLWDGADIATERRTSESFTVRGARLTIALQVQEATLQSFFDRTGALARGTGFLARFLMTKPDSTQGGRFFVEAPENWPALDKFNHRITAILEQEVLINDEGALEPPLLSLPEDTKAAWVKFHDAIEIELRAGGELYEVRDVASKTADNAVRISALLQIFEQGMGSGIDLPAFEGASRIAAWHLHEARCFFNELALPDEQVNAVRLDSWLINYCRREKSFFVPRREIQRNITPVHLRHKSTLDTTLVELVESGRVRIIQVGRRKEVHINPALLEGE